MARYYLPFDTNNKLFDFVKAQVESGDWVIIDAVMLECEYTSKKLIVKKLEYLLDKEFKKEFKIPTKTKDLLPPSTKKFYNMVDDNFRTPNSRRLNDAEFEQRKKEFLDTADARMIIYALNQIHSYPMEEIAIVTEESETANDHKAFKKIPAICNILDIKVMTLPELLSQYEEVNIEVQ